MVQQRLGEEGHLVISLRQIMTPGMVCILIYLTSRLEQQGNWIPFQHPIWSTLVKRWLMTIFLCSFVAIRKNIHLGMSTWRWEWDHWFLKMEFPSKHSILLAKSIYPNGWCATKYQEWGPCYLSKSSCSSSQNDRKRFPEMQTSRGCKARSFCLEPSSFDGKAKAL